MTFDEYTAAVDAGNYPEDPRVPQTDFFTNENGRILNVAFGKFGGAAIIDSKSRTVRSNHYHKTDWHYLVVLHGVVQYFWRPVHRPRAGAEDDSLQVQIFREGEAFFTPPLVEHAVFSVTNTQLLSLSHLARRHDAHEADLVRVELVKLDENGKLLSKHGSEWK